MARNSTEELVAITIWSRDNPFILAHGVDTTFPSIYKHSVMLVLKEMFFFHIVLSLST